MKGSIISIKGIVVDIQFPIEAMPGITHAVKTERGNGAGDIVTIEVLQHLDEGVVRGIAMQSTDGLRKGDEVVST